MVIHLDGLAILEEFWKLLQVAVPALHSDIHLLHSIAQG